MTSVVNRNAKVENRVGSLYARNRMMAQWCSEEKVVGTDVFTPEKRSEVMSRIRGKNTIPERRLRSALHVRGYRFRLHRRDLPGTPDIVFPSRCLVIFVHGCFWHLHKGCKQGRLPRSNVEFWTNKLNRNRERDNQHRIKLRSLGWRVLTSWECQIERNIEMVIKKIDRDLRNG